jgi:MFS family permease
VKNASPIQSGLYLLPVTVLEALMGIVGGLVIHRTGRYQELIWIGMILMTLGIGLFINIGADTSLGRILAYEVITGIGAGLVFNPPLIAIQALVAQDDVATATAAQSFLRNLGMSVGLVVGGVIIQNGMSKRAGNLRAAGLSPALLSDFTGGDAAANVDQIGRIGVIGQRHAVQEAFAWSLQQMWIVMVVFTAVGLIASAFITKAVLSKEHVETKTGLAGTSPAEKQEDPSVQQ